ncbi:MAG: hypothetical protein A2Y79_07955 [Deltaproteobacteria bacterium RBG_13_43_22]|nr:MAG: hypothetical protein A2Y79_07955 [Deltaproteobacteria bacterium RBG_13_43_22]
MTIDKIDEVLILELQKDGRCSYTTMANAAKISLSTVYRRVKRLVDDEIIEISGIVDYDKLGLVAHAIIGLDVDLGKIDSVCEKLANIPNVSYVGSSFGRFDIIFYIHFSSPKMLSKFIKTELSKMEGILDSEAFLIADIKKKILHWSIGKMDSNLLQKDHT